MILVVSKLALFVAGFVLVVVKKMNYFNSFLYGIIHRHTHEEKNKNLNKRPFEYFPFVTANRSHVHLEKCIPVMGDLLLPDLLLSSYLERGGIAAQTLGVMMDPSAGT